MKTRKRPTNCAVTVSVQLVGLFLVFITLVVPALTTFYQRRRRYLKAYSIGVLGYAVGLLASLWLDLPSGAMIVCAMVVVGTGSAFLGRRGTVDAARNASYTKQYDMQCARAH